jgi:hypothetical protein
MPIYNSFPSAPSLYGTSKVLSEPDQEPPPGAAPNYSRGLDQMEKNLSGLSSAGAAPTLTPFVQTPPRGTPVSQLHSGALWSSFNGASDPGSDSPSQPAPPAGPAYDSGLQQLINALSGMSNAGSAPTLSPFVQAGSRRKPDSPAGEPA